MRFSAHTTTPRPMPFLLFSGMVIGICCTPASNKTTHAVTALDSALRPALQADSLLHQRLQAVLDADNGFAQATAQAMPTTTIDARNEVVTAAEIALKQTIDSLEQTVPTNDTTSLLQHTIGYFKNILQSRVALADLRMVLSANSDDSTAMHQNLAQLRTELQEKNRQLATMERTHNDARIDVAGEKFNDTGLKAYAPAKGETLADMKQRNTNLALAYSNLQNKYFVVGRNYLLLKQEHERTLNELAALRKAANKK